MTKKRKRIHKRNSTFSKFSVFNLAGKLLLAVIVIIMFLTLSQCTIEKPEAPTFTTNFVVPVINRTYPMSEIVDKIGQSELSIDTAGNVVFSITEDIDTLSLDQSNLSVDDLLYNVGKQLGPIDIDAPTIDPVTLNLSDLVGVGIPFPGDSAYIPESNFDVTSDMPPITSFSSATFSQGSLDVIIMNELGILLDNVSIDLVNTANSQIITTTNYPDSIPTGSTAIIPLSLVNRTVPNEVSLVAHYYTPADTIDNFSTRYITTALSFSDTLQVSQAVAQVPALSRTDSTLITLSGNDRIDTATLSSGLMNLTIINMTSLPAVFTITVPDFIQNNQPLVVNQSITAQQTTQLNIDLAGYQFIPQASTVPQELSIFVSAGSPGSGTEQVPISSSDSFAITAALTNLNFNSVTGQFQAVTVTFDSISQNLDIPTGFENFELVNAILSIEIENAVDLPGTLDIQLTGDNGKNLVIQGDVEPRGLATSATSTIVSSNVADFLSPIPSRIDITGTATFGGGGYQGTITSNDYLFGRVHIFAPLEMIINESTIDTDIESSEINQDNITAITDHFLSGRFVFRIVNRLPIGAHVNVFLGGDSTTLYTAPQVKIDSLYVTAAPTDSNGLVIDSIATDFQEIYLDSMDIKVLENDTLYVGQQIVLDGSNGQPVKLTEDNYISILGRIEVEYLFDGEF